MKNPVAILFKAALRGRPGLSLQPVQTREGPAKRWKRIQGDAAHQMELDFDVYRHVEVRPDATQAQKALGRDAVKALLHPAWAKAGGEVLGSAVQKGFVAQGGAQLIGQEARTPQQLAAIAQVVRDPRFETFRMFYTKAGKIVGHTAITSRLPGAVHVVSARPGENSFAAFGRLMDELGRQKEALGADGYWMLHNHPSGTGVASQADINLTQSISDRLPGCLGHVIVDSNEYGHIPVENGHVGRAKVTAMGEPIPVKDVSTPEMAHALLGTVIDSPSVMARIAKTLETRDGFVTMVGRGGGLGKVTAIAEIPASMFFPDTKRDKAHLIARLRKFARQSGSSEVLAVTTRAWGAMGWLVRDGIMLDVVDGDSLSSWAERDTAMRPANLWGHKDRSSMVFEPSMAKSITLILPSGRRLTLSPAQYSPLLVKALGPGERWITVHPNGDENKGVPVLIRENPDGSAHVIGGAGGKLNYLKLKGVRKPEEYRAEIAEKRKAQAQAEKERVKREKELGTYQAKTAQREQVAAQQREAEREFVKTVAEAMGWEGHQFNPDPYLNLSDAAQKKAIETHHREWLKKAKEAVQVQRDNLLHDADAREQALGEVPLQADAVDTVSVNDLDPVKPAAGLGYAQDIKGEAEKRGADASAVQAEKQAVTGSEPKPEAAARRQALAEKVVKELDEVREPGPVNVKAKIIEAKKAVQLLKAEKLLKSVQRQARAANQAIDKEVEPKGAYILEATPPKEDSIREDLENDLRTLATRNFLTEAAKHGDLGRHVGVGAYNAINAVSLATAGAALLDRQAVDILGVAGATQVLAQRLRADLTEEEMEDLAAGLQDYHVDHYMQATEKAIGEALEWQKVAEGIELEAAGNGHDLARMRELNHQRMDAIDHANRLLGTTLGEMEANAALLVALKQGAKDSIEAKIGSMPVENVIRMARAIGLDRGDYQINSVGSERFLTVNAAGMKKLARPVNREDLKQVKENLSIMRGDHDEDNWLPKGVANRPDLAMRAEPSVAPRLAEPFAPGADMAQSVRDYIGGRTADGDAPADIVADLLSQDMIEKAGDKDAYLAALDKLAPMRGEDGKMIRAEAHQAAFEKMADEFAAARGGAISPLHRQTFNADQASVDALHRALSAEPAGVVAYKPVGDLESKDQSALRGWWWTHIGKKDEKAAGLRAELAEHENAEPEKESVDMFGETATNPEWTAWKQERDAKAEALNAAGLSWAKYANLMGGPAKAYAAVQDLVRGNVARHFHAAYNTLNPGKPLKLGRTVIAGNLDHLDAVDPEARERRQAEHRSLVDSLRERVAGKYASGAVSDKIAARREEQAGFEQSQMGFFSSEPEPEQETPLAADQRHTLGQAAEQRIAGMMSVVGQNFKPDEPTRIWQPSMNGKFINQQRAIKLLENNRRLVLAQGVGSGKTVIGLGGFTHLHAQGKAKRGLFVVPSIVQNQFNGEALRYLEPGKFKWHIAPGASREERIRAYQDPETHFSVVTHQGFRDDMVHLGAKQAGLDEAAMAEKVNAMTSDERKTWMRGVMDGAGMDHDYLMVDEGHDLLNRAGKENSLLANVIDSVAHNVTNYVNASADPVKNSPDEAFDVLHKMDPARYHDQKAFMRKYGVDTDASRDELRRELARYFYPGRIDSGKKAERKVENVPLSAGQKTAVKEVERNLAAARLARMKGTVDVAALRALSPSSFSGVDEARHEEVARKLQSNLGILKDTAYRRAINEANGGAKQDAISRLARERAGKPGVIFAHSLEAVRQISERLKAEGHRVVTLTGADSAKEKGRKKLAFNPEAGEATADIMVASDAGAVGMNAQRGQWLIQYDTPDTAKTHHQRNGRIDRLGQKNDVELIDLVADHPSERRARERLMKKDELRGILTSSMEGLDDTGLAAYLNRARMEREQKGLF